VIWSFALAILGILAAGGALGYSSSRAYDLKLHHCWLIGVAALFPAWLVAFLVLLQPATLGGLEVPLPPQALLSSGVGLGGIIVTDYLIRKAQKTGRALSPLNSWALGVVALAPACLVAWISLK
jgi:hypothetical protein